MTTAKVFAISNYAKFLHIQQNKLTQYNNDAMNTAQNLLIKFPKDSTNFSMN